MLNGMQKTAALAWAAKREKVTYGNLAASLTEEKKRQIYSEYEAEIEEKKEKERQWLAKAKEKNKTASQYRLTLCRRENGNQRVENK